MPYLDSPSSEVGLIVSVSKFREVMEKSGCRWVLTFIFALLAVAFVVPRSSCSNDRVNGPDSNEPGTGNVVAQVGDFNVTESAIDEMAQQSIKNYTDQAKVAPGPMEVATYTAGATDQQIKAGLLLVLAKKNGVSFDDDNIMKAVSKLIDQQIEQTKMMMTMSGKVKPDASPAIIDAEFKKENGVDEKTMRERMTANVKTMLGDPNQKQRLLVQVANSLVMDAFGAKFRPTDAELKAGFDTYNCKRVFLRTEAHAGEDLMKKAASILAEIKGGMTFEAAMDKYSDDAPAANKAKHDNQFQVDGRTASLNASYAPITKLAVNETGGPFALGDGGISIVKFVSKTNAAPTDFDKQRAQLTQDYQRDHAATVLQDELKKLEADKTLVKWLSPGYSALYELLNLTQGEDYRKMTPQEKRAKLEAAMAQADAAKNDPKGMRAAVLASFLSFDNIWRLSTDAEKAKLTDKRIEAIENAMQQGEDINLRLELADLYGGKKEGVRVADNLSLAANVNASNFDPSGQAMFSNIQARVLKFKATGLLKAGDEAKIRKVLDQWLKDKHDHDAFEAEQKKAEADARAKAEADAKKEAEEAKKNAKATPPPTPPSGAPPAGNPPKK